MSETAPPAPAASSSSTAAPGKPAAGRKARKPAKAVATPRRQQQNPAGPSVSELLVQAAAASKERNGLSLAALKKALAAAGYDVDKNNSRIKLGLKSLVGKGTLVQTKGTGASGSFKLNKKAAAGEAKPGAAKVKAEGASKKAAKKVKKPFKKVAKSPAKVKAAKPKAAKAKVAAKPKKAGPARKK